MSLENKDWLKFTDDALEFAFRESSLVLNATLNTFKDTTNRSYIAMTVYLSVLTFHYQKPVTLETIAIILGSVVAIFILWENLMPEKMSFTGTEPQDTIHEFYENSENQVREMKISKLIAHEQAIKRNRIQNTKRNRRFQLSTKVIIAFIALAVFLRFIGHS